MSVSRVRAFAVTANIAVILGLVWTLLLNLVGEYRQVSGPGPGEIVDVGTPVVIGNLVLLIPALALGLWAFERRGFSGPLLALDALLAVECVPVLILLVVVTMNGRDTISTALWTTTLLASSIPRRLRCGL